jgi:hypothetical protein
MILGAQPTRGMSRYLDFIGIFVARSGYLEAKITKQSIAEPKRRDMLRSETWGAGNARVVELAFISLRQV